MTACQVPSVTVGGPIIRPAAAPVALILNVGGSGVVVGSEATVRNAS